MKKILFLCTSLLIFNNSIFCDNNNKEEEKENRWAVTLKNGYFYPQDCNLRNIFCRCGNKGGYWVEGALRYNMWKGLDIEASGSYFKKDGKALCGNDCTTVRIPTFGLGLKYFFNLGDIKNSDSKFLDKLYFFLGAGMRIFFYKEKNCSCYVQQCVKETKVGGMVNVGFEYDLPKNFFLDLFFDYNFKEFKPCCNDCCCNNSCCTPCCSSSCCNTCCNTNCCNNCCNSIDGSSCPSCFDCLKIGGLVVGLGIGYKF